jgi:hypothetical protein
VSGRLRICILTGAAATILAAAALFLKAPPALELRAGDGRLLASCALDRRQPEFQISYLHSVARAPAIEYFRALRRELELYKTAYQGLGAGLPFGQEGGTVRLENGWIIIEGLHRRFPSLTLSPMPLTEHRLRVGGRQVDLPALSGGRPIGLHLVHRSLLGRLVRGARMEYIKP